MKYLEKKNNVKKGWSVWAVGLFAISLIIGPLFKYGPLNTYLSNYGFYWFMGFIGIIVINIFGVIIAKKQNKKGAILNWLAIILAGLLFLPGLIFYILTGGRPVM